MRTSHVTAFACCLVVSFTLASASPAAAQLPAGITQGVTVEGITEYDLANGLRVLLLPDRSAAKFTLNVTYLVGSRNEGYGEKGMAHLLEHMMFRGTPTNKEGKKLLTDHGAIFNGSTWYDRTNYFEILPAADTTVDWVLGFEADRMVNSSILKEEFDKEMTVVRNEFEEGENSEQSVLIDRVVHAAYSWHNYQFSAIGPKSDIERVPVDRLHMFYAKYYQPDNAVIILSGNFDPAKALARIAATFGAIPRPQRSLESTYTIEPPQDGERTVTLRRTGDTYDVCAGYHVPCGTDSDAGAVEVLMEIISDPTWGRLYHALVEPKLASSIAAFTFSLKEPGIAIALAETNHGDSLDMIRDIFLKTIESVGASAVTQDEVSRARATLQKQFEQTSNSSQNIGIELSESAALGDWRMFFVRRDWIKAVTAADVQRVAAAYLKPSNRTLGVFIPTKAPDRATVAAPPDVAALVAKYKPTESVAEGEQFDPTPEVIDTRTQQRALPNGLKLGLLSKRTRAHTVNGVINLRFGAESTLTGRTTAAGIVGSMLMRGTKRHTREQIHSMLDTMKATLYVGGNRGAVGVNFQTTREHLAPLLALVAEVLREPAFDPKELALLVEERVTELQSVRSQPFALAFQEFNRRLQPWPKDNIRYSPPIDEQIERLKAVKIEDVQAFYKDFYGAGTGEAVLVGDFDSDAVTAQLTALIGNWKSPAKYARIVDMYRDADTTSVDISAPDKAGAVVIGGEPLKMREDDPDYPAMVIGNYLLGGGELSSRLSLRLRDKEGLSYGVGSFTDADVEDSVGQFGVYGICAPQNVTKFESSMRDEIALTLRDGFHADELEKGRSGWLQSRKVMRATDGSLAYTISGNIHNGRTMAWQAAMEKHVSDLNADQITEAMRRHVEPKKMFVIRVADSVKH